MKALNRAVKRNADRCPKDFMFQTSSREWENLKYQIGTSSSGEESQALRYQLGTLKTGHGGRRKPPYVFTEHGAIMAANVLNSHLNRQKHLSELTPALRALSSLAPRSLNVGGWSP